MTTPGHVSPQISGVILAGGKSSRFGLDKAFLRLGSQSLIERTVETLSRLSSDLIVVTNSPAQYDSLKLSARLVRDIQTGKGSLMGIYSGLRAARYQHALAIACDMPFVNVPLLRYMVPMAQSHDVVIPYLDGYLEPLHAIYSQRCLIPMETALRAGEERIVSFFDQVQVRRVHAPEIDAFDPQHLSVFNMNTDADWMQAQELFHQRDVQST